MGWRGFFALLKDEWTKLDTTTEYHSSTFNPWQIFFSLIWEPRTGDRPGKDLLNNGASAEGTCGGHRRHGRNRLKTSTRANPPWDRPVERVDGDGAS